MKTLPLDYEDESLKAKAEQLAASLNLEIEPGSSTCLWLGMDKLMLKIDKFKPMFVDFSPELWQKRRAEGKRQGLIRACKPGPGVKIIDATAGWGRDAAILSSFGAEVVMIERHPIMAALLQDALDRCCAMYTSQKNFDSATPHPPSGHLLPVSGEKENKWPFLVIGQACAYLNSLSPDQYPDVIYIDPMHPMRTKSALVKKEMQVLQQMIGPDEDALDLLECAIKSVKQRVVVKWPQKAPALRPPDLSIEGKTVRFDIYLKKP